MASTRVRAPHVGWVRRLAAVAVGTVAAGVLLAAPGIASSATAAPTTTTVSTATAKAATKTPADPAANVPMTVDYAATCYASAAAASGAECERALVTDINAARAREHVRALVLPRGYRTMPKAQQVFVLTNLERVDRGLAPLTGINAALSTRARQAAAAGADPSIANWKLGTLKGQQWSGIQAADSSALESDWLWMYSDGWGGNLTTNVDCSSPKAAGCWGHRHNVLATYGNLPVLVTGTAAVSSQGVTSFAQLVLAGTGKAPALTYTWKQAVQAGAGRH